MDIAYALAVAQTDAARLQRFIERRERFQDALDWSLLSDTQARESAMMDDLLTGDVAEASLYVDWLTARVATGTEDVIGVLRFAPAPRPWQAEWITIAA